MKKKRLLLMAATLVCVATLGLVTSCAKDNEEGVEVRLRNMDNGGESIALCRTDDVLHYSAPSDYASALLLLTISSSNNFHVTPDSDWGSHKATANIASVGRVSSLRRIKKVPASGWTNITAISPGNGYVVRHEGTARSGHFCKYARIYVSEWVESTSGGIIGAVIRYEDNWMP